MKSSEMERARNIISAIEINRKTIAGVEKLLISGRKINATIDLDGVGDGLRIPESAMFTIINILIAARNREVFLLEKELKNMGVTIG